MVLVIATENDSATSDIIRWLEYFKCNFEIINENNKVCELIIDVSKNEYQLTLSNSFLLNENNVSSIWLRNGKIYFEDPVSRSSDILENHYKNELETINQFLLSRFNEKFLLGNCRFNPLNKLIVLKMAEKIGFKTPNPTLITNRKSLLGNSLKNSSFISKTIGEIINDYDSEQKLIIKMRTSEIDSTIQEGFFPSLLQSNILKRYEIRTFVFNENFYSIAIFSQHENSTRIDFRNDDNENLVRYVPYELEDDIKCKIISLMLELNLKIGSVDLIKAVDGSIYFLEINPSGQFGFVSYYGNYFIEKKIAETLITHN
jgi:ATP-GRASP peptide maturase of grasp-with-spasm system